MPWAGQIPPDTYRMGGARCGMPHAPPQVHGNLMSYKHYLRPTILDTYGTRDPKGRHQKNVHRLLHALLVHGPGTTWDTAKAGHGQVSAIRTQEKIYRRLLIGRFDRGRYSGGLVNSGLVIAEDKRHYSRYRLSVYGILYCMDVLNLGKSDHDGMAGHYAFLLPRIFSRWERTSRVLGDDAYNLRILAKGIYLNNMRFAHSDTPLYELMSYLHIKYRRSFEAMAEDALAEQVSYWFYIFLLYSAPSKLKRLLASDGELHDWFAGFFGEAESYYAARLRSIKGADFL